MERIRMEIQEDEEALSDYSGHDQGVHKHAQGSPDRDARIQGKYSHASMNLNPMTVTVEQLINYFNKIESLLTEFNTTQGYHSFLGVLQLGDQPQNPKGGWKNPKVNGTNGSGDDGKGKKGKDGKDGGKGGKDGKDSKKTPPKDGKKTEQDGSASTPSGLRAEGEKDGAIERRQETVCSVSFMPGRESVRKEINVLMLTSRTRMEKRQTGEGVLPDSCEIAHVKSSFFTDEMFCLYDTGANCMVLPNDKKYKGTAIRCTLPGETVVGGHVTQQLSLGEEIVVKVVSLQGASPIMPMTILTDMAGWS
eukprot:6465602-Amphidinium_carterae.1